MLSGDLEIKGYKQLIQEKLSDERILHSLNVARRAVELARHHHADERKAEIAGLLHDLAKNDTYPQQLQTIENGGIILTSVEKKSPQIWHAIAASVLVRGMGLEDEDIQNAIRFHTTARAQMSVLEKIVYLADLTSDDRIYPDVDRLRELSDSDLDAALYESLCFSIPDLVSRGLPLHPDTVKAYNQLSLQDKHLTEKGEF